MSRARPLVLVVIGAFWPGNDASGPNQSFQNLLAALGDIFEFHLLARDRPFGVRLPQPPNGTLPCSATWLAPGPRLPFRLLQTVLRLKPDLVWLNGFFDREFTLPLLVWKRLGGLPRMLLSPRGEFSSGALALKRKRKRAFLAAARTGGLLRAVTLHATGPEEEAAIRAVLPHHARIAVAPNVRPLLPRLPHRPDQTLRVVFLSRITAKKNLDFALRILAKAGVPLRFDIHGPVEDQSCWDACRTLIAAMPPHVTVRVHGVTPNAAIPAIMAEADLFFLPTAGENFGHAIFEALSCGVPVLVSDQTPWRNLKPGGWDLALTNEAAFVEVLRMVAAADAATRNGMREAARRHAEAYVVAGEAVARNRAMLTELCAA